MKILGFKHFDFDEDGAFVSWTENNAGHEWIVKDPAQGLRQEWLEELDLLVILGGPMSVYEEQRHAWLAEEKRFVKQAIDRGKKVLGICLGAQMIADVLGSAVYRNEQKEIGWHRIERTEQTHPWIEDLPAQFYSFQWHGDTFDLPQGAVKLAQSEACPVQAFSYGEKVLGLQFHLETTPSCIETMLGRWSDELAAAPYIQSAGQIRRELHRSIESRQLLHRILSRIRGDALMEPGLFTWAHGPPQDGCRPLACCG